LILPRPPAFHDTGAWVQYGRTSYSAPAIQAVRIIHARHTAFVLTIGIAAPLARNQIHETAACDDNVVCPHTAIRGFANTIVALETIRTGGILVTSFRASLFDGRAADRELDTNSVLSTLLVCLAGFTNPFHPFLDTFPS